ncbi:right-handed parallel beta-helix repeat-containing protein [Micromonospora inyonensis]|uniref:Right handed beta helix region n=1 Tax=Micromonospora inyonensis TaxID=47866 RepID=A0A1C6S8M8_9ACTN|nr:right-handed parallel beta-helix repeat-containing protein [Micromonospora inyonensis]SCL25798.1 Right handed beta helix region [Micromonospora inyonensis]
MPRQATSTAPGPSPHGAAGAPSLCNAREHGLTGDGTTNDQPALAALVNRLGDVFAANGRAQVIYCPPGVYAIRDAGTVWRSGVSLVGAGPGATRFVLSNEGNRAEPVPLAFHTAQLHGASPDHHLAYCTFTDFEIDGSGVASADYNPLAKGLGLQYVIGGLFRNLFIHHTAATGFGCDFLQDTLVEGVRVVGCGRMDNGLEMGGAGIGVGIGAWGAVERLTIANCSAVGNATNGIFLEMQYRDEPQPRGIRIANCHAQGNRFGIADWGADGLIVTGCTMTGNLEAGFQVSAKGTTGIPGKGGLLTDCVIDGNLRDGVSIGNTRGPYTVRGNRISGNGRYGYHHHDLGASDGTAAEEIVIESNDIWGNSADGIRFDRPLRDTVVINNRIRNNGRQRAPATAGGGESVRYRDTTLVDHQATWPKDGHRGKVLRVGDRLAVVAANDENTLTLAPIRPGATSAWSAATPLPGAAYELPAPPANRAGITINASVNAVTIRGNLIRDNGPGTQTHGLWITDRGSCLNCRVVENDLDGNRTAIQADTPAVGGHWEGNYGNP